MILAPDRTQDQTATDRLHGLDALRGLAALAVVWFHMTHGGELLHASPAGIIALAGWLGHVGHHGVALFFVVSGFVIPLSLKKAALQQCRKSARAAIFCRWMAKRLLRLQPPFAGACILALLLNLISSYLPGYLGSIRIGFSDALVSFMRDNLFLSGFLGTSWILVVAWTLSLEVQFYLFAGIAEPAITPVTHSRRSYCVRSIILIAAITALGLLFPSRSLVFRALPMFLIGWLQAHRRLSPEPMQLAGIIHSLLLIFLWSGLEDFMAAIFSIAALQVALKHPSIFPKPLLSIGAISYSLYLVHVPIGGRIVNLASRINPSPFQWLGICLLATALSVAAATIFYFIFEYPSHAISRRINLVSQSA